MQEDLFGIPATVSESNEWKAIEARENLIGPDQLLAEITDRRSWSNAEILWVLRRMVYYYGKKDELLNCIPKERLFMNMVDTLRAFFILFDGQDPDIDENTRLYISAKLADATWGINSRTRKYLHRL